MSVEILALARCESQSSWSAPGRAQGALRGGPAQCALLDIDIGRQFLKRSHAEEGTTAYVRYGCALDVYCDRATIVYQYPKPAQSQDIPTSAPATNALTKKLAQRRGYEEHAAKVPAARARAPVRCVCSGAQHERARHGKTPTVPTC